MADPSDELYMSPQSDVHPQVMRAQTLPAALLEGESMGPNYENQEVPAVVSTVVNGDADALRMSSTRHGVGQDSSMVRGCGADTSASDRQTGLDEASRETGPDGTANAIGVEARVFREPPMVGAPVGPQSQHPPLQPQQPPPQLHMSPPPFGLECQQLQTPPRQQTQQLSVTSQELQELGGTQRSYVMQSQYLGSPPTPSPSQHPDPAIVPPPLQVVRSLTAQMASAAASMGQRVQLQTMVSQGPVDMRSGTVHDGAGVMNFGVPDQGYGSVPQSDPPPLPQHLRSEHAHGSAARSGVLAGLARAGQVLRRRVVEPVLQQVNRGPVSSPSLIASRAGEEGFSAGEVRQGRHEAGVFTPAVAEAMNEWTTRASLISPGTQGHAPVKEDSSASSISPEVIMEEVRRQVQLAMAEKEGEVRELKIQNENLKRALIREQVQVPHGVGCASPQGLSVEGHAERLGMEPKPNSDAQELLGGGRAHGDPRLFYQGAGASGSNPSRAGEQNSVPVGDLGGVPGRGVYGGGRLGSEGKPSIVGPGPMHSDPSGNGAVSGEPLQLLVQGMRQLQQAYMYKSESKDSDLKGSVQVPEMPEVGAEAAVAFADWLYELEQSIGGMSDRASVWFTSCLSVARQTYTAYTLASPLERLTRKPQVPEALKDEKWSRLEKRVMALLLGSMKKTAKDDAITHRVEDVTSLLYRLHVLYQPGGASERAAILKQLEGRALGENVYDCVMALRKWRRYIERAEAMQVSIPDASLLLGGLELMIRKVLEAHPEVKFRVALMKNELQLQGRPTVSGVLRLHTHVLAELQTIAPLNQGTTPTALKAVGASSSAGTGEPASPPGSPTRKNTGKLPCKFFLSKTGCTRGPTCKFEHTFESKEEKRSRCWECGSQGHRRSDCPVAAKFGKGSPKSQGSRDKPSSNTGETSSSGPQRDALPSLQQQVVPEATPAQSSQVPAGPASSQPTAEAKEADVKELLREANAMLSKLTKLQALEVRTNESIGVLSATMQAAGVSTEEGCALLDSGASHVFRQAREEESAAATPVRVELAGGQHVTLRQNKAGTLLATSDDPSAQNATPILPLGALVQRLGCDLRWTRKGGLKIIHPQFGVLKTFVKGNHPMLVETQALELISQLEDLHLRELEESTMKTLVRSLEYNEAKEWDSLLDQYVLSGQRDRLLAALLTRGSPLGDLSHDVMALTAVGVELDDKHGWKYLKSLPFNRKTRKAMMAKRWSVRLFRRTGESDLGARDSEHVIHVDFDVARSRRFSLRGDSPAYKALMWAAARGQLDGIVGAPPVQDCEELLSKQLTLWTVSRAASRLHGFPPPYLAVGSSPSNPMWGLFMWKNFTTEFHVPTVQLEPDQFRESQVLASTLTLEGRLLRQDLSDLSGSSDRGTGTTHWGPGVCSALSTAIARWRQHPEEMYLGYLLHRLDAEGAWTDRDLRHWRQHVANGHLPFDKRCKTCITTAATGRAHRRVLAPSCYTLSLDVCGPFRRKGEYAGSKGYRYAMVGTYIMPKLEGYKDVPIPEEPDYAPELAQPEEDFLEEQGPQDPPLEAEDQAELDKSNARFQALYKEIGDGMDYQTLHYAIPLKSRLMPEVEAAVKQMYLQIRSEGLPVTRVHSDRARELRGGSLRAWLLHRDILPTTGEAQAPQTNGRAEAGVKRAKTRTKVLLRAAGLDTCCWPSAMTFAAFQQRECALGRSRNVIAFGSPVLVKNKAFGVGNKFDLDDRWQGGIYVGPSPELRQGHMVRFPSGRVVTSLHIRSHAVDADGLVPLGPVEASFPIPSRRITGKRPLAAHEGRVPADPPESSEVPLDHEDRLEHDVGHVEAAGVWTDDEGPLVSFLSEGAPWLMAYHVPSDHPESAEVPLDHEDLLGQPCRLAPLSVKRLRPLSEPERRAEELAESYLKADIMSTALVLELFEVLEEVKQMFTRASRRKPISKASCWTTGAFTHGGVSGLRDGAKRLPSVTKFLAKFAREFMGAKQFGAVSIQRNGGGRVHRDFHNFPGARNWLCPLTSFEGGGLWRQLGPSEDIKDGEFAVCKEVKPGLEVQGRVLEAVKGKPFSIDPKLWHEAQPHEGERVMVIAYTPRLNNFDEEEAEYLKRLGFLLDDGEQPKPFSQGATSKTAEEEQGQSSGLDLLTINETQHQLLEGLQDRSQALRLLLEEEQALAEDLRQAGNLVEEEAERVQDYITQMRTRAAQCLSDSDRAVLKVCLKTAAEPAEPDYEHLLEMLQGDLQVAHTVPLSQVRPVVERWHAAIRKELDNLIKGGTLEEISREEAHRLERRGVLRLVPSKGVYTLKPPGAGDTKYKRKCRLVLCGNFAAPEEQFGSLYAGGASAETFRTVLAVAAHRKWLGATADITGAFLLAPWPDHLHRYAVVPPRLLIDNKYISQDAY